MSEIEMLNMELSKLPKMDGLKIMRISKESFKRISEVYRFLLDKINIEDSKASFQIRDSDSLRWEHHLYKQNYLKTLIRFKVNLFSIQVSIHIPRNAFK